MLCYNTINAQGSYIGNTTASQAVKAGSIPVPCSKKEKHPFGVLFFFWGYGNDLNATVRWTVACEGLTGQHRYFYIYLPNKLPIIHSGVSPINGNWLVYAKKEPRHGLSWRGLKNRQVLGMISSSA